MAIPQIIMQTWKDRNIPKKWKKSIISIRKHMPDWKHVLMTDEDNRNFVKINFPDFLPYYDSFEYNIQRVDAFRACWLYINGGLYLDLDYEILRPFGELFEKKGELFLVRSANVSQTFTNSFMASKPGCVFWLRYIDHMKKDPSKLYIGKHLKVMATTGPWALTRMIRDSEAKFVELPTKYIIPCNVCDINCDVDHNCYLKPLSGNSWHEWDSTFYNFVLCKYKSLILLLYIFGIMLLILIFYVIKICG